MKAEHSISIWEPGAESEKGSQQKVCTELGVRLVGWTWQSRWRDKDLQLTSLIPWPGCPVGPQGMPPGVGTQLVEVVTKDEGGG